MARKSMITTLLAAGAAGAGGYYVGETMDAKSAPTSKFTAKAVLIPGLAGVLGYFVLRRKNPPAAKGLLYGGLAGAAYGYFKGTASPGAGGTASATGAGTNTQASSAMSAAPGGRRRRMAAYLGAGQRANPAVRKILNSPTGAGIGSILPKRLQSGSSAFPNSAWSR
jgi:hypothetical protein